MQPALNEILCATDVMNTGLNSCYYDPKNFEGAVLVPKGKVFTQAEMLTFSTVIAAAIANDTISNRIFPITKFCGFDDKSSEAQTEEFQFGGMDKARNGKHRWYYQYRNGGTALHIALSSFDGKQEAYDVMFLDFKNRTLVGRKGGTNNTGLGGFNLELIDVPNYKINDGSATTKYSIGFCLENPEELNSSLFGYYQFPTTTNFSTLFTGLKNIEVAIHTANVAGLIKLTLTTGNGAINLYDVFPTELATSSLYTAKNGSTQVAITVTSVTAAAATKTFNLQLDASDTDYTGLASGGPIDIVIGNVTALIAASILGYGGVSFTTYK